ncbi:hypothetical protein BDZ91DRAFT_761764 [Kalaharituber pfeilii]|nr:hypothetical protein BDZ91DRAFT_761764 [Kalaharituber pfeilii]
MHYLPDPMARGRIGRKGIQLKKGYNWLWDKREFTITALILDTLDWISYVPHSANHSFTPPIKIYGSRSLTKWYHITGQLKGSQRDMGEGRESALTLPEKWGISGAIGIVPSSISIAVPTTLLSQGAFPADGRAGMVHFSKERLKSKLVLVPLAKDWLVPTLDPSTPWPPPDPERETAPFKRHISDPASVTTALDDVEYVAAFRRRQQADLKRWQKTPEKEDYYDYPEGESALNDDSWKLKPASGSNWDGVWRNDDGETLADYGVDEEAEGGLDMQSATEFIAKGAGGIAYRTSRNLNPSRSSDDVLAGKVAQRSAAEDGNAGSTTGAEYDDDENVTLAELLRRRGGAGVVGGNDSIECGQVTVMLTEHIQQELPSGQFSERSQGRTNPNQPAPRQGLDLDAVIYTWSILQTEAVNDKDKRANTLEMQRSSEMWDKGGIMCYKNAGSSLMPFQSEMEKREWMNQLMGINICAKKKEQHEAQDSFC